jgi:hypothetical protein
VDDPASFPITTVSQEPKIWPSCFNALPEKDRPRDTKNLAKNVYILQNMAMQKGTGA